MRCQACERNETRSEVICETCRSHYLAIREGRYEERELVVGETALLVHSWVALPAPAEKRDRREAKAAPRRGLFGRKPVEPTVEEAPPPPDWKNRVFPAPDPEPAVGAAPETPLPAPEPSPWAELSVPHYGAEAPLAATQSEEEVVGSILDLDAPVAHGDSVLDLDPPAAAAEAIFEPVAPVEAVDHVLDLEAAAVPPVEVAEQETFPAAVAEVPPVALEEAPAPALPDVAAVPPAPEPSAEAPAAPSADLSAFFSSLAAPAPAEPAAAPEAPKPDLGGFFASLAAPSSPAEVAAAPAAAPSGTPDLGAFFASLSAPSAPTSETIAPEPSVPSEPVAEAPAALPFELPVAAEAPAEVPFVQPAEAPEPMALTEPAPAPESEGALSDFFATIQLGTEVAEAAPEIDFSAFAAPAPQAPEPAASEPRRTSAFEIPIMTPIAAVAPSGPKPQSEQRPPVHGEPFSISLEPSAPQAEPPRAKTQAADLKAQHSTDAFSFVADEEEEHAGGGLFDGLRFGETPAAPAVPHPPHAEDDDEPGHRTIEL